MKKDYQDWMDELDREFRSLIDYELNGMDMGMLNLDLNWEEYGLPKAKESKEYNLPRYIKGSGRKPSTRAKRIKQTKNYKKKNKKLLEREAREWADYKGIPFEEVLNSYSRRMISGSVHPYSDAKGRLKWYKKSLQTENERKFAKREIKNYHNDIINYHDDIINWDDYLETKLEAKWDTPKGDYICTSDKGKGYLGKRQTLHASTPVKEVLFNCLLNS